jgi:hypothetical protein
MMRDNAAPRDVPTPLRGFVDRVVVPALLERFLHETKGAEAPAERAHKAISRDVLATEVRP